jgi:hypothetical protein
MKFSHALPALLGHANVKQLFFFVKSSHLDGVKLINVQMTLWSQLELAFADHLFLSGHAQWDC